MICQWCKRSFPGRTGRFCGTCQRPDGVRPEKKFIPFMDRLTPKQRKQFRRKMKELKRRFLTASARPDVGPEVTHAER